MQNAEKFCQYNRRVRLIKALVNKAPHLGTHLTYSIRAATGADFYVPDAIADECKIVDVSIGERLCGKLSCTKTTEQDFCKPASSASYYRVGENGHDVQYQPACFNVASKQTYSSDGVRSVDTPRLNYANNACRIVNDVIVDYLEKTYKRSATHHEMRVNDMPTGYERVSNERDPASSGYTYTNNAAYCGYFDREFEADTKECVYKWWETGLDYVVGMSLINTAKSSIRSFSNNRRPFALPANLQPIPTELRVEHTFAWWKADVNKAFIVPDELAISLDASTQKTLHELKRQPRSRRDTSNESPVESDDRFSYERVRETLAKILLDVDAVTRKLLEGLFTVEMMKSMGVSMGVDWIIKIMKKKLIKIAESLSTLLAKGAYECWLSLCRRTCIAHASQTYREP